MAHVPRDDLYSSVTVDSTVRRPNPAVAAAYRLIAPALGCFTFALYWRTAARRLVLGDGPILAAAGSELGVPPATGYPLYTLLAHLFIRLIPAGEPVFRTAILSSVLSAITVVCVYLLGQLLFRNRWIAMSVAVLLAVSDTFWSQAVVTGVFPLHHLLLTATLLCLFVWDRTGVRRYALGAALLAGLAIAHHVFAILWLPGLLLLAWTSRQRAVLPRARWLIILLLSPLALYSITLLTARRDPAINWGDARNLSNLAAHAGDITLGDRMGFGSGAVFRARLVNYAATPEEHGPDGLLRLQYPMPALWLAIPGLIALLRLDRRTLGVTALLYGCSLLGALAYYGPDYAHAYLGSHLIVLLWIGFGLRVIHGWLQRLNRRLPMRRHEHREVRVLIQLGLVAMPMALLPVNYRLNDLHGVDRDGGMVRAMIERIEPRGVVIVDAEPIGFGLQYASVVEKLRPDVRIVSLRYFQPRSYRLILRERGSDLAVAGPGSEQHADTIYPQTAARRRFVRFILDNYQRRPVYLAGALAGKLERSRTTRSLLPAHEHVVEHVPLIRFLQGSAPGSHSEGHP